MHARTHAHTHTHARTHAHTHTHTRTRAHTHTHAHARTHTAALTCCPAPRPVARAAVLCARCSVDIICCCAVLFPIIWNIQKLRDESEYDGKAARNLVRLQQVCLLSRGVVSARACACVCVCCCVHVLSLARVVCVGALCSQRGTHGGTTRCTPAPPPHTSHHTPAPPHTLCHTSHLTHVTGPGVLRPRHRARVGHAHRRVPAGKHD
jgi:hypothetical protein